MLTNGRPAAAARLQWLTGTQTTASVLTLRGTWATALVPRVVCLLGLTLPVGTLITLAFRRAADAGYTYLADEPSQRVVQLPDGSRCAWFVLDAGLDAVIGVEYRIANDINGAASIAADSTFDVGEAWVGPAVDIPHEAGWARGRIDPTALRRSKGGQLFGMPARSWRNLQVHFTVAPAAEVDGSGLANGADWEQIESALVAAARCCAIPRWIGQTPDYLQRTALFAAAVQQGNVQHVAGNLYSRDYTFEEMPAMPA
ncbi:MAG: hypothetical protein J0H50_04595 [Xanthomonadales bacterium]|nr:hypothetical protein [Xanthomonadales bacterium]